jgi:hypothetical protein
VRHVAEDGEDQDGGEQAGARVHHARDDRISKSGISCYTLCSSQREKS